MQSLMTIGHAFESAWSETLISDVFSLGWHLGHKNITPAVKLFWNITHLWKFVFSKSDSWNFIIFACPRCQINEKTSEINVSDQALSNACPVVISDCIGAELEFHKDSKFCIKSAFLCKYGAQLQISTHLISLPCPHRYKTVYFKYNYF